ncbi:DUF2071 domain-containing protein [Microbacterium sp. 4R-513]|uniref:YqjF family protein n=1 Tax=Microbacterium sp. 4R-513 TaxID=2567934 RepID=UPI0013E1138E|nr:DUF2071 domain-containing protein [Microbacterium sp. 4R-513]QIG39216.1 DUF2071 domain-containing protein [Microbacterium sp. 4R-513]
MDQFVEDVTPEPARPVERPLMVQRWQEATFLHWPVAPEVVAPFLPAGTRPDILDGVTFVGIIGFRMEGLGLGRGPGLPYFGTFCETNVRLYSVDRLGRRGVVFRSLDASRLVPVLGARAALRLRYMWSRMRMTRTGDVVSYRSARHVTGRAPVRFSVQVGQPIAEPTPLEHFVTARWALHTRAWGRTLYVPNDHPRWPLHRATLTDLDEGLIAAAGLPAPDGPPPSVLYSPGVPVVFGRPVPL